MTAPLSLTHDGPIARITFQRPKSLNAIDRDLAESFEAAVEEILTQTKARVLILSGEGRSFMAGGDLGALLAAPDRSAGADAIIAPVNRALMRLRAAPLLTIALVQGPVAGAGLSLALAADFTIAADNTQFNFAYLKVGAPADCGITWALPRAIGLRRAMWLAFEGSNLPAATALEWGMVGQVTPLDELEAAGATLAAKLTALAPVSAAQLKGLMLESFGQDYGAALEAEKEAFKAAAATEDFAEAITAFFEKRPAHFSGR